MKNGDFVYIDYIGRLESGEIFDLTDAELAKKEKIYSSKMAYKPIPIVLGEHFVIPGIEDALLEMKIGDEKDISISPEKGFGSRDPKLVRVMPKNMFRDEIKPGMVVDAGGMRGRVQSINAGRVRVDFNNPMAGKVLNYKIMARSKAEKDDEKVKALMEYFGAEPKIESEEKELEIFAMLPPQLKPKLSELVFKHTVFEKIKFIEIFEKKK